ncbi:chromosomal replication initiator DnaA [Loktanella sp. M215]|uniref:chromosomal replication initiator DnaA n=1 Tax=Loktanella sp. M215 TaxID=2675431 RepID=UPI001F3BA833|nr:chromosomal replication initiator DnaA [Loktanella sp. M215]
MARQLTFDWPVGVALGAEDFFVAEPNRDAYAMIGAPAAWPQGKLVLTGPEGSGKSHLARVFAARHGARIVSAEALPDDLHPNGALVVEDADRLPRASEEALFHLHNHMASHKLPLLLTARSLPVRWDVALPDLASRMQATTPASIAAPDDALLQAVLMKLFADRQILPPPGVVAYLVPRIERSFAGAQRIVADLDALALQHKRAITVKLAAQVLDSETGLS